MPLCKKDRRICGTEREGDRVDNMQLFCGLFVSVMMAVSVVMGCFQVLHHTSQPHPTRMTQ